MVQLANARASEGTVQLPRVTSQTSAHLRAPLMARGMAVALRLGDGGEFPVLGRGTALSDVVAHAAVEITEGYHAPRTSPTKRSRSKDRRFRCDRPFLLALRHDESGALVLVGERAAAREGAEEEEPNSPSSAAG